ncbi:MAG TPA: SUMF1/EgtB/PvdO family nonheme iron enzyme [Myxococcota bacterium]|nr:SUMF1/EgtB/PvdO family nonheme iron enzyme [Myxococcota bacterium]
MFPIFFRCWLAMGLLVGTVYAGDLVTIGVKDFTEYVLPIDTVKMCPVIHNMIIEDFGGYEKYKNEPFYIPAENYASLRKLSGILNATKMRLNDQEISNVEKSIWKNVLLDILKSRSGKDLLEVITAANSLGATELASLGCRVWARRNYLGKAMDFSSLPVELQEMVIDNLTPKQFITLVKANNNENFEDAFRIALRIHYEEIPSDGVDPRAHYENLQKTSLFVRIPGGDYEIGSPATEKDRDNDERLHRVSLSPFWIMRTPATQEDYAKKTGKNPSVFSKKEHCPHNFKMITVNGQTIGACDLPVERVTWSEAKNYADMLSKDDPQYNYYLVSEARLEVAMRGGVESAYVSGDDASRLGDYVWYGLNSLQTQPARSKPSNAFGYFYNSVPEWTADLYDAQYSGSEGLDPIGPVTGTLVAVRGGSFKGDPRSWRLAHRANAKATTADKIDYFGFRLVREKKK